MPSRSSTGPRFRRCDVWRVVRPDLSLFETFPFLRLPIRSELHFRLVWSTGHGGFDFWCPVPGGSRGSPFVSLGATLIMKFQYHLINTLNQAEYVLRKGKEACRTECAAFDVHDDGGKLDFSTRWQRQGLICRTKCVKPFACSKMFVVFKYSNKSDIGRLQTFERFCFFYPLPKRDMF